MLQQAVEKIDRLRDRAHALLCHLMCSDASLPALGVELAYRRVCHSETYDVSSKMPSASDVVAAGSSPQPNSAAWPPAHANMLVKLLREATLSRFDAEGLAANHVRVDALEQQPGDRNAAIFNTLTPLLSCDAYRQAVAFRLSRGYHRIHCEGRQTDINEIHSRR